MQIFAFHSILTDFHTLLDLCYIMQTISSCGFLNFFSMCARHSGHYTVLSDKVRRGATKKEKDWIEWNNSKFRSYKVGNESCDVN